MPFRLVRRIVHRTDAEILTTEVPGDQLRIGRGTDNDLHLDAFSVSYTHATIQTFQGVYVLRNLTGANLTFVNQVPVREIIVEDGDLVRIGPYSLRLSLATPGDPLTIHVEEDPDRKAGEKVALLPRYTLSTSRWTKKVLSLLLSILVLAGAVLAFGVGKYSLFLPGELSLKHSMFADQCMSCHTPWTAVWSTIPDKTCETCHSGPTHFSEHSVQATPQCVSCHLEHQGKVVLAATPDQDCVQCHGDLMSKGTSFQIFPTIHSFTTDHPEFAVSVLPPGQMAAQRVRLNDAQQLADQATLKLNHKLHLSPELLGPEGIEPLTCTSCHRAEEQGAYMAPISYEKDCMRCHLLDVDDLLPMKTVTHGIQPAEIHRELQAAYSACYILAHESELRARGPIKRLPGRPCTKEEMFVDDLTHRAERHLYSKKTKKCLLCHEVDFPETGQTTVSKKHSDRKNILPVVLKNNVPTRWLPFSQFNHAPHYRLSLIKEKGCVACHESAPTSVTTADVLLPGIGSCQACHFEPSGAQAKCVECHVYHDQTKQRQAMIPSGFDEFQKRDIAGPSTKNEYAVPKTNPSVIRGEELVAKYACKTCHRIHGEGAAIASDLSFVADRRPEREWHLKHFLDPQSVSPGSLMPKFSGTDDELNDLTNYMLTLQSGT